MTSASGEYFTAKIDEAINQMETKMQLKPEKKKAKANFFNLLRVLLMLLIGVGVGYFIIGGLVSNNLSSDLKPELSRIEKILLIPAILIPIFLVIVVHELGHLLTGLAQGFKFQLFIVGPLGIKRDEETDRVKVYFNKELNLAGGLAATIPTREAPGNIRKFARLIIAGPLASLLLGGLLFVIAPYVSGFIGVLISIGSVFSFLIFLVTIFPVGSATFMSDGKRFLRLLKPETRAIELAIMRLGTTYTKTRSYEHLKVDDIELMKTDTSPMMHAMAYFYAYLHYLSLGQTEKAQAEEIVYREKAQSFPKGFRTAMEKEEARIKRTIAG